MLSGGWIEAMTTRSFQDRWKEIAARWGLQVETSYVVKLARGTFIVPILLRDFGAPHGMLLVTDFGLIATHADELVALGFGYSCRSGPTDRNHPDNDQAFLEMLSDWRWTGDGEAPAWYRGPTS